jgi:hypothetical protein
MRTWVIFSVRFSSFSCRGDLDFSSSASFIFSSILLCIADMKDWSWQHVTLRHTQLPSSMYFTVPCNAPPTQITGLHAKTPLPFNMKPYIILHTCVCVCVCVCFCMFPECGWHLRSLIRTRAHRKHDHFALSILNTGAAEENGRFFHLLVFWYYLLALENKYAQYALENKYTCMKALKKQSSHTLFPENSYSPLDIMSDSPVIAISEIWRLLSLWYPARVHTSHRFRYT